MGILFVSFICCFSRIYLWNFCKIWSTNYFHKEFHDLTLVLGNGFCKVKICQHWSAKAFYFFRHACLSVPLVPKDEPTEFVSLSFRSKCLILVDILSSKLILLKLPFPEQLLLSWVCFWGRICALHIHLKISYKQL